MQRRHGCLGAALSAQVFSSRQNLSTDILVGNATSGDLDHLKMITYLVRLV
ncbi:MAG: hypothetical protein HRT37_20970 [Alteromonadaceae bacterium]|nr:hypothetical protein [Alteromonadaceae bacterium]